MVYKIRIMQCEYTETVLLEVKDIRVLCVDISSAEEWLYQRFYEQASPERKCRADRYRRQEDKLRCVAAEAILKVALGTEEYQIEKNNFGKPYIKNCEGFFYNLSHSGRYVVIAWGESEVGVDIQEYRENVDFPALSKRFFTSEEQTYIGEDLRRFYEIWTKKESYVKYTGEGLERGLGSFCVLEPELPIRYRHWTLEGGYCLSLCTTEEASALEMLDVHQLL